jgi:thymidylate synthase
MGRITKNEKPTSVWTNKRTRDALKEIAGKMGIPQGKCLELLIKEKVHRDKIYNKKKRDEFEQLDTPEAINQINRRLEKIEKRENPRDTIVSFFRTQERDIFKPMSEKIDRLLATLQEILDAIDNIK